MDWTLSSDPRLLAPGLTGWAATGLPDATVT
jgi:hypothetical protein